MKNVWLHEDPVWVLELLEAAAPCLEELEVVCINSEQLQVA